MRILFLQTVFIDLSWIYPWIPHWDSLEINVLDIKGTVSLYWKNVLRMRNLWKKDLKGRKRWSKRLRIALDKWSYIGVAQMWDGQGERMREKTNKLRLWKVLHIRQRMSIMSWGKGKSRFSFKRHSKAWRMWALTKTGTW